MKRVDNCCIELIQMKAVVAIIVELCVVTKWSDHGTANWDRFCGLAIKQGFTLERHRHIPQRPQGPTCLFYIQLVT